MCKGHIYTVDILTIYTKGSEWVFNAMMRRMFQEETSVNETDVSIFQHSLSLAVLCPDLALLLGFLLTLKPSSVSWAALSSDTLTCLGHS